MTEGVTRAVIECLDAGSLQGTGVMAGGSHAESAMRQLRARPWAFVAVHLNLLEGKACAPLSHIPDIVDTAGFFRHTFGSLWRALTFGSHRKQERLREQAFMEFRAQIDAVRQGTGNETIRLDGHLHIHAMPGLLPVMEALFLAHPVSYVRIPFEARYFPALPPRLLPGGVIRRELLAAWSRPLLSLAAKHGISTPDAFLGAYASGSMNLENLRQGLAALTNQKTEFVEVMLHPGDISRKNIAEECAWYAHSPYRAAHESPSRRAELAMLRSTGFAAALGEARNAARPATRP